MAFDYNPQDKVEAGGKADPGEYTFKVDQITEVRFRTGSEGWKVELMVGALPDQDLRVYINLVNTPNSLWVFEAFCSALGFDFNAPPRGGWQPHSFENKMGRAKFKLGEKGYLEVDEFIPASANNGPDTRKAAAVRAAPPRQREPGDDDEPPPISDSDIPL